MKNILIILALSLALAALPALAQTNTPPPAAENSEDENPTPPPVLDEQGRIVGFVRENGREQPTDPQPPQNDGGQ